MNLDLKSAGLIRCKLFFEKWTLQSKKAQWIKILKTSNIFYISARLENSYAIRNVPYIDPYEEPVVSYVAVEKVFFSKLTDHHKNIPFLKNVSTLKDKRPCDSKK